MAARAARWPQTVQRRAMAYVRRNPIAAGAAASARRPPIAAIALWVCQGRDALHDGSNPMATGGRMVGGSNRSMVLLGARRAADRQRATGATTGNSLCLTQPDGAIALWLAGDTRRGGGNSAQRQWRTETAAYRRHDPTAARRQLSAIAAQSSTKIAYEPEECETRQLGGDRSKNQPSLNGLKSLLQSLLLQ